MAFHCVRCKAEIDKDYKACPHCGEPVTDFLRRYANEPVDGKYELLERLGAGGMGEVYKVNHTYLGATRVIKVIRPQISESKDAHDRFLREARTATKIQHPNVATLHDFSALPDGSHYMVWEYIEGENLAQRIRSRGVLQPRYAVQIAIQALHGLEAIHRAGIVHRDISPENIMITPEQHGEERVKVIDLGVAKSEEPNDNATRVGVFVGKLRYASPEHLGFLNEGERIDGRADLYSLAMVLYESVTGRPPFEATSPHEYVLLHSRDQQFKPLDLPSNLPGGAELQAVLAKGLERDRNKRFTNAREFANALEQVERSLPDPKAIRTMNIETPVPEADMTFRQTPLPSGTTKPDWLHRQTQRTGVGVEGETIRTPLPGQGAPARPTAQTVIVARTRSGSTAAFLVIAVIVLLAAGGIAAVLYFRKTADVEPPAQIARTTTSAPVQTAPPPQATAPQASVEVVTTTPIATTSSEPLVTTSSPPPTLATTTRPPVIATQAPVTRQKQPPPVVPPPKPRETEQPRPPVQATSVRPFIDGDTGDADVNEELVSELSTKLIGVTSIAVRGTANDQQKTLIDRLKRNDITVADNATTVVDFDGTLEQMGRGKKRRSARATITKDGRVIFRYELPPEEYRVGDSPAEAFARILSEAFGH
jgi:eukaryotic-like serine/threonine-protein kinase